MGIKATLIGVVICAASFSASHAATYSAAGDFSLSGNPNGVWSYLYNNALLSQTISASGYNAWWSGQAVPNSLIVGEATSGPTSNGTVQFGTNYLTMDPESQTVDVRFTAPSTGTYLITGQFFGADSQTNCQPNCASHPVLITDSASGTIWGANSISTFGQAYTFSLIENLTAGEQVDFLAETGTSGSCTYCNLSTGLEAEISATPLPAALPMFAAGLGALALIGKRRKRKASMLIAG
jgi:hypothetical protein